MKEKGLDKMLLNLINTETVEYDFIPHIYIFKNRGHQIATYTVEEIGNLFIYLDNLQYPTDKELKLLKLIREKVGGHQ